MQSFKGLPYVSIPVRKIKIDMLRRMLSEYRLELARGRNESVKKSFPLGSSWLLSLGPCIFLVPCALYLVPCSLYLPRSPCHSNIFSILVNLPSAFIPSTTTRILLLISLLKKVSITFRLVLSVKMNGFQYNVVL